MDNSVNGTTTPSQASGAVNATDPSVMALEEKKRLNRALSARDGSKESPENNAKAMAFLVLLINAFKDGDLENATDEDILSKFEQALGADAGIFSGIFAHVDSDDSPIFRALQNEKVSGFVREKYGIENPLEFATSAREIFADHKGDAWEGFLDHLMKREGYRNTVYADSLGKPTVGVGHLVKPEDNLRIGDKISDAQVMSLLKVDASAAYKAAIAQAKELGIEDKNVVIGLASVNYQLGLGWRSKFPSTWDDMKNGDFESAIAKTEGSKWNRQTPVRVDDFHGVLARAAAIRDGKIEAVALNDTNPKDDAAVAVASAKTGLSAEHEKTLAAGGVKESTPPASGTEEFTLAMSKGGTDEVAKTASLAANAPVYDVPPLLARPAQMGQTA